MNCHKSVNNADNPTKLNCTKHLDHYKNSALMFTESKTLHVVMQSKKHSYFTIFVAVWIFDLLIQHYSILRLLFGLLGQAQ